jgi:hypothetical protein
MAIEYAGGTTINTTFSGATRPNITSNLETQLLAAGWTVVSGSGTTDVKMQSATTPEGVGIRVRFRDPGSGTRVYFSIEGTTGSPSGANAANSPALEVGVGKTYRIIACKYNAWIATAGNVIREFVCFGTLWMPSFLVGVVTDSLGYLSSNVVNDASATVTVSLRGSNGATGCQMAIRGGSLLSKINLGTAQIADMHLTVPSNGRTDNGYRWDDNTENCAEPQLAWGLTNLTDEAKIRGQIHNAVWFTDAFAEGTPRTFDGRNWYCITNNNSGNATRGSLFVLVP